MKKDLDTALYYARLGEDFYFGYTVKKDLEKAKESFCLAALYGEGEMKAEALCNLALLTDDPYAKLALYAQAAEEPCADAINMTGVCCERIFADTIYGPEKAQAKALEWYREAAAAGSAAGMYNCALREKKRNTSIRWLKQSAALGHGPSAKLLEQLMAEEAEEKAKELDRLSPYLKSAQAWAGKPAAILTIPNVKAFSNKTQLAFDIAAALEQSVILLFDSGKDSEPLYCVGYDYGKVGLAAAMNNRYAVGEGWGLGNYMTVSVRKEYQLLYCTAVREALEKTDA